MSKYFYIKKIIRDDKEQFEFDQFEVYLDEENSLLARPEIATTSIDYTEADGGEMISQRLASGEQTINGIIIPKTNTYWTLRKRLTDFFQTKHNYYIIYEKKQDGTLFKTGSAWISTNLQVPPEPRENYSKFTVTLTIGSPLYQSYAENDSGDEVYTNNVDVGITSASTGGAEWVADGAKWSNIGLVWQGGNGGPQNINLQSTVSVYPVWVVEGSATNPVIRNDTNGTSAQYTGTIASDQTLTVDFSTGTAMLNDINVTLNLSGGLRLDPGTNALEFELGSGDAASSTLKWDDYTL